MEKYLGIDVGGTSLKYGIVSKEGELLEKVKYMTSELRETGDFINGFIKQIGDELKKSPEITKVGIAVPGMISKDRKTTIFMANISEFNNVPLIPMLEKAYPKISFYLENDANAAAIGEYHFAKTEVPDDFLFMTLGTGLGSAAILDGKIFKGGEGNALEAGHIISSNGKTAEENMGKAAMVAMVHQEIKKGNTDAYNPETLRAQDIILAALNNEPVAVKVFEYVGSVLGEALVSTLRILDLKTVFIGGGVSKTFSIVEKNMMKVLEERLPNYYTDNLDIRLATLGNNAGIIGAAALCFK